MTDRLAVALLFGGRSSEHSISCATAAGVLDAIDRERYDVIPVGITHEGAFTLQPDDAALFALNAEKLPVVDDNGTRIHWPESAATRELTVIEPDGEPVGRSATSTSSSRSCTARGARTARSRGCSNSSTCRTSAAACSRAPSAWTSTSRRPCCSSRASRSRPGSTVTAYEWAHGSGCGPRLRARARPPGVRQAGARGLQRRRQQGHRLGELDAAIDDRVRRGRPGARSSPRVVGREVEIAVLGGRPGEPTRASVAGEIVHHRPRLLRLRRQVPRRARHRPRLPGRPHRRASSPTMQRSRRAARSTRSAARGSRAWTSSSPQTAS